MVHHAHLPVLPEFSSELIKACNLILFSFGHGVMANGGYFQSRKHVKRLALPPTACRLAEPILLMLVNCGPNGGSRKNGSPTPV